MVPNASEKRDNTFNNLVSRYKKQTRLHGANVSRTTQPTSKEETITSKCSLWKNNAGLLLNQSNHNSNKFFLVLDASLFHSMTITKIKGIFAYSSFLYYTTS